MKSILGLIALCVVLAPASVEAQEAVFVIRHAEKQASGDDPGLTTAGRVRASAWARMLAPAGIAHVITTDARRTRETGGLIAEALGVPRSETGRADVAALLDALEFDHADARVLVVGHTETIPSILSGLGAFDVIGIAQDDYANLFIATPGRDGNLNVAHLRMP